MNKLCYNNRNVNKVWLSMTSRNEQLELSLNKKNDVSVVDLFCGIGGLTHGLVLEGLNVKVGYDIDNSCQYAYEKNNKAKFIRKSVSEIEKQEILEHYNGANIKILIGCAPCQPFSCQTLKKDAADKRWGLLYDFLKIAQYSEPHLISMENVPNLMSQNIYYDFEKTLKEMGYFITAKKIYCPDYGIPQKRTRLVLLASKFGDIDLIKPTHNPDTYKTVEQTIGHLKPIQAGQCDDTDRMHYAKPLSTINLQRIQASKEGGTWEDWQEDLKLECHKRLKKKMFTGVYGRMKRGEPSPTLTTYCTNINSGRFGHYAQDRAISLREASLLQTFPATYDFINPDEAIRITSIARHIGNAVPVDLGRVVAKSIKQHLQKQGMRI